MILEFIYADIFTVSPYSLKVIEKSVFLRKNMNNNITVIHKDPIRRAVTLNSLNVESGL